MDLHDFAYSYGSSGDLDSYDPYGGDYSSPTTTNINYDQYDPYGGDYSSPTTTNINYDQYDPYGGDYTQPSTPNINYDEYDPYGGDTSGNAENIKPGMGTGGTSPGGLLSGLGADAKDFFKSLLVGSDGKVNPMGILGIGALMSMLGKGTANTPKVGYQGGIPKYTAVRQQIQYPEDPNRRPGAGGRSYFTPMQYVPETGVEAAKEAANAAADAAAKAYKPAAPPKPVLTNVAGGRDALPDAAKRFLEEERIYSRGMGKTQGNIQDLMDRVKAANPNLDWSKYNPDKMTMDYDDFDRARDRYLNTMRGGAAQPAQMAAQGGLMNLARGRYLNGSTDGMADKIPASIENKQPAALSHGEFVIPADVVSHLGNGNSEAGAQRLYDMMEKIRKARTGNPNQGKQINPDKYMPK